MASLTEAIRSALVVLERIESATKRIEKLEHAVASLDQRLRVVETEVATLKEARAAIRDNVRAEIAEAIADLRVRYAEQTAAREPKQALPKPRRKKKQ